MQNLGDLTIERARQYLVDVIYPLAVPIDQGTIEEQKKERIEILFRLYKVGPNPASQTVWTWLTRFGFAYKARTKRFFVDTHESPANRKYGKEQTACYLKRERRMFRWYQFTLEEIQHNESGQFLPGRGYHYKSEDGTDMVELHVDEIPVGEILDKINQECRFGGNLSVQKKPEEKPLLAFGHDECIFRQFIFTGSTWTGPKGERPIIPKDVLLPMSGGSSASQKLTTTAATG